MSRIVAACLAGMTIAATSASASASGLYFSERGVRPLARGGAFVAGADDLGAIAYNPAGIWDAGMQFFGDASWVHFTSDYERRSITRQYDPNTGQVIAGSEQEVKYAPVEGTTPFLPIPTLAFSVKPHPQWTLAAGIWAPYAAISTYPEKNEKGQPSPQRYSLLSLESSALAVAGVYAAYSPIPNLRIGLGFELLAGKFTSTVMFSACVPDRFFCAPEQPEFDTLAQLDMSPIVAPSGNVGVIYIPHRLVRVGASFHLPFWVRSSATVRTRLPSSPVFEQASQEGEDADVAFDLPWNLRVGVEARPIDGLRIEAAFGYDHWAMHDTISITPDKIALRNVAAFPETYYIPPVTLNRGFQSSISVRLGGEYTVPIGDYRILPRAGVSFETSAVPPEYLSVLTLDAPKVTPGLGVGFQIGKIRLDATYAHVFAFDVDVDPRRAKIAQVNPVDANAPAYPNIVNGGTYSARADVIGLGLAYSFDGGADATPPVPSRP